MPDCHVILLEIENGSHTTRWVRGAPVSSWGIEPEEAFNYRSVSARLFVGEDNLDRMVKSIYPRGLFLSA